MRKSQLRSELSLSELTAMNDGTTVSSDDEWYKDFWFMVVSLAGREIECKSW